MIRTRTFGDGNDYLFGKTVYPIGGSHGPRIQKDYQLITLISGSLRVTVNDVAHDLSPGDAILQHPGRREFYRFSARRESEHGWCQIATRCLSRQDKRLLDAAAGAHKAPASIHLLLEEGLSAGRYDEANLHEAMLALARACLLRFAAHVRSLDRRHAAPPLHPALARAQEIVTSQYAALRSADDLAERVGISATQLRSLCRRAKSESPSDMIWRLKAEHAIQLIRSTGLTLGEIAESCGYANPFHLSRSVKRYTGYSPRGLRRAEWGSPPRDSTTAPPPA